MDQVDAIAYAIEWEVPAIEMSVAHAPMTNAVRSLRNATKGSTYAGYRRGSHDTRRP
jgi:hypothetical protein